ncbi:hypothetical protein E4U10_006834 [Claviceps purpurea]|nr:hypothetical protein E4U10_006834 [Claviceps purpurea]
MASSQDEFLSPEEIAPTTHHAITSELPQSIRRFYKEVSSEWKRGCIDPDSASPQDATYWMANRVRQMQASASASETCSRKRALRLRKNQATAFPSSFMKSSNSEKQTRPVLSSPIRPTTPAHPVNETQPIQTTQQIFQRMMQEWPNPLGLSAQSPLGKEIRPVTCDEAIFVFVVKQG